MRRALITGAEGFTGRYMARELEGQGYEVHGLVRSLVDGRGSATTVAGCIALHACDLFDAAALAAVVQQVQPDKVVHLAAIAFVAHDDAETIYRTNLVGTRHLLAALAAAPQPPTTVLLASSANVYGNVEAEAIDETVAPAPANDYAVSKLAMEYMAATWAARLPIVIARPFNYTGVGQAPEFLLPKVIAHFRERRPLIELGNLDVEREFCDVRTVVGCYRRLLDAEAARGRTLNVCSGIGHTLRGVLQMTADIAGYMPEVRVNPAFVRANEVRRLVGSRAALERVIGPVDGLPLRATLQWMFEHRDH